MRYVAAGILAVAVVWILILLFAPTGNGATLTPHEVRHIVTLYDRASAVEYHSAIDRMERKGTTVIVVHVTVTIPLVSDIPASLVSHTTYRIKETATKYLLRFDTDLFTIRKAQNAR